MVAADLDLIVHNAIRLFMREEGLSADEAFDAALSTILDLAPDIDGTEELVVLCMLLPQFRESVLSDYRKPQPDLSDLEPVILARKVLAVECQRRYQRQRRRRRQLGGRP